jgi:hypothetical protein
MIGLLPVVNLIVLGVIAFLVWVGIRAMAAVRRRQSVALH